MAEQHEWVEGAAHFLEKHASFRRWIIVTSSVFAPLVLGILALPDALKVSQGFAYGAILTTAVVAILLGIFLAATEESSGEILAKLGRQTDRVAASELQVLKSVEQIALMQRENDRLAGLATLQSGLLLVLNEALALRFLGDAPASENVLFALLQEAGAVSAQVFGWSGSERWSIAIYRWDASRRELVCAADVRNISSDHGEGHRAWPPGEGMVGVTFQFGEELVVSDAHSSELQALMRDPDEDRATEDRDVYRSVAAVPIFHPDDSIDVPEGTRQGLFGVVVATSDQGARFTPVGDNELAPLRSLADAVQMALTMERGSPSGVESGHAPD